MNLRVTVARLLLLPVLAMGATTGALAADSPFAVFKKIVILPKIEREAAVVERRRRRDEQAALQAAARAHGP